MSIASEIQRIQGNIANAYTACDGKGATMPVAADQNSDNLADTIETISVGGGGSGIPAEVKSLVDNVDLMTLADGIEAGWQPSNGCLAATSSQLNNNKLIQKTYQDGITVLVFDDDVPDIIKLNNFKELKVSTGTVLTDTKENPGTMDDGRWIIDFTDAQEKWIAFPNLNWNSTYDNRLHISTDYSPEEECEILSHVLYICVGAEKTDYSSTDKSIWIEGGSNGVIFNRIFGLSKKFKGVYVKRANFSINYANDTSYCPWGIIAPLSPDFDIEQFITDYVNSGLEYGITSMTVNSSFQSYHIRKVMCTNKFPIVLDCSGLSATSDTWYIGATTWNNQTTCGYNIPSELFIVPADMNITWGRGDNRRLNATSNGSLVHVSTRSIKYLADHSPNVSSKTLTIGAGNIARINAEDATIIPALQAKGWTVQ